MTSLPESNGSHTLYGVYLCISLIINAWIYVRLEISGTRIHNECVLDWLLLLYYDLSKVSEVVG